LTYSVWHRAMLTRIRNVNGRKILFTRFPEQDSFSCGKRAISCWPFLQAELM
jgi:hypothetical protein